MKRKWGDTKIVPASTHGYYTDQLRMQGIKWMYLLVDSFISNGPHKWAWEMFVRPRDRI